LVLFARCRASEALVPWVASTLILEDAMKKLVFLLCVVSSVLCAMIARASSPTGVTFQLLSRGTFQPFHLLKDPQSLVEFEAKSKSDLDVVVRQHNYAPHGNTGWHAHPGPVFITVTQGTLTFYEYDDPTCTPKTVDKDHGYVDTGKGHIGVNNSDEPAQDISVILAPVGTGFRSELAAPSPYCGF
jgi:hypothetical protein